MAAITFTKAQARSFQSVADRAAAARGKGLIAFEIDGVVGRLTKKQSASANLRRAVGPIVVLATLYLAHARRRLLQGRTATPPRPYDVSAPDGGYFVSNLYASRKLGGAGKARNVSSADFHRGSRSPGYVTGGLMSSLIARGSGNNKAIIDAQGSSIGSSTIVKRSTTKRGKVSHRARKFAKNSWKAAAVFRSLGVNMMQPTDAEVMAMGNALGVALHREVFDALLIGEKTAPRKIKSGKRKGQTVLERRFEVQMRAGTDPQLYERLVARWVR